MPTGQCLCLLVQGLRKRAGRRCETGRIMKWQGCLLHSEGPPEPRFFKPHDYSDSPSCDYCMFLLQIQTTDLLQRLQAQTQESHRNNSLGSWGHLASGIKSILFCISWFCSWWRTKTWKEKKKAWIKEMKSTKKPKDYKTRNKTIYPEREGDISRKGEKKAYISH